MTRLAKTISFLLLVSCLTSCCYRMPEDDEFSLVPATNNPSYTREKPQGPTPGVGM